MAKYIWPILALVVVAGICDDASARTIGRRHGGMSYYYESPAENVRKSNWYDYLLTVNGRFRAYRIRKECGPIRNDPPLYQHCVASFDEYEPIRPGYR